MSGSTSRLSIPYPVGADRVTDYPPVAQTAAGILDNAVTYSEDVLANRPAAGTKGRIFKATNDTRGGAGGTYYLDTGVAWVWVQTSDGTSGAVSITAAQTTSSASYTTLTTPDQVTLTVPTNGVIAVMYQARLQESVSQDARAAIFIGSNQLKIGYSASFNLTTQAAMTRAYSVTNVDVLLSSFSGGLVSTGSSGTNWAADVTTGQVVGVVANGTIGNEDKSLGHALGNSVSASSPYSSNTGNSNVYACGPCYVFAAAGTTTVSVQFSSVSGTGTVTAKNRKLWAWVQAGS